MDFVELKQVLEDEIAQKQRTIDGALKSMCRETRTMDMRCWLSASVDRDQAMAVLNFVNEVLDGKTTAEECVAIMDEMAVANIGECFGLAHMDQLDFERRRLIASRWRSAWYGSRDGVPGAQKRFFMNAANRMVTHPLN